MFSFVNQGDTSMIVYNNKPSIPGFFSTNIEALTNPIAIIAMAAITISLALLMRCLKNHSTNGTIGTIAKAHKLQTSKAAAISIADISYSPPQAEQSITQQQEPQIESVTTISGESSAASPTVRMQSEPQSSSDLEKRAFKIIQKHLLSPRHLLLDSDFHSACYRLNIPATEVVDLISNHKVLRRIKIFQDMLTKSQRELFLQLSKKGNSF